MPDNLQCYRCGADLSALSLPLSRADLCPDCGTFVHCCRLCVNFDRSVPRQCREDDAEEVTNKETANFCDWFEPASGRYAGDGADARAKARQQLDRLFGGESADDGDDPDDATRAAEDLFR